MQIYSHTWYHRRHHTDGGFRNVWDAPRAVPFWKSARWLLGHAFEKKDNTPPPVRNVAPETLAARPDRLRLTWIGHSSALLQTPAFNLLTDPVFSERASPFSFLGPDRKAPPALRPETLPDVDLVLISHDHYDHLDERSIQTLERRHGPLFLVPLGVGALVRAWGASRVLELDWWQYVDLDGWRFHCTPARHFSGRGLTDRNSTLWAGWFLEALDGSLTVYFAGDSAYADLFTDIRERLDAPEVALIPIGAYRPRWFMEGVHVDPAQAVRAFVDLQARHFIPIHWGTFDLADEPLQEPPDLIRQQAASHGIADRLHLLDIGGQFLLDGLGAPATSLPANAAADE